jgi:hypothetical protein
MSKHKFKLGALTVDAQAYGSQGNAILGIRDSGKTYTGTKIAEHLFDAGVPFITFDPTGVWRFLRVPGNRKDGKGRGNPIVVTGGKSADLPLTPTGAVVPMAPSSAAVATRFHERGACWCTMRRGVFVPRNNAKGLAYRINVRDSRAHHL